MAFPDELFFAPASELLTMLRSRQVSAAELISAFIDRIESLNPHLRSVVTLCEERAAVEADEADRRLSGREDVRPLEGLPITVKDSIETKGVRTTAGMKIFEHHVPHEDAPTVARLRAAGAIVVGKTNLPEMALDYDCENPVFGATNNPWNSGRVPGGSSGGEAASLASGLCALGIGSDYGGSIRIPAHFCGVVGLKPTWGTIPVTGHIPPLPPSITGTPPIMSMATIGPMARYVDDLTLEYNLIRGPHPSAPYTVPSLEAHPEIVNLEQVTCAYFTGVEAGVPIAAEIRAAVERAATALSKLGVAVEHKTPPIKDAARIWMEYATADGGELLRAQLGTRVNLSRERLRQAFLAPAPSKSAAEFFTTAIERDVYRIHLAQFMERYPIIIGAPFCVTAFEHGGTEVNVDGKRFPLFAANWPALWVNCAGLPAAVVPAGCDRDGLPIGVQIVGRAFEEETVLAVAKALEQELRGFRKPPLPH